MNTSLEEKRKRKIRLEFLLVGLYLIGLTLILVGPAWLMEKMLSRIALLLLFASPWIYLYASAIRAINHFLQNNPVSGICLLTGIVLLVVALFSGETGLWIPLGGGTFLILSALILLIPSIKKVPEVVKKKYQGVMETYKEISEHHSD